jgi:diguanylate cyclase (GGDEF)-like protein/PAS domain S-box-containing protein
LDKIHSLLLRQIKRYFGSTDPLPKECPDFINAVNNAYLQFDSDRSMLERSLELSSQELIHASSHMRAAYERIVNSSVDGIFAFDRDCRYTVWNPGMERITGVSEDKALGKGAFDIFSPFQETAESRFFSETLAGKTIVAEEKLYTISGTGKQGFFEGHFSPLRDESGDIMGGLAIIRDITERKRAEETIQHMAFYDTLTELPNRNMLYDRLLNAIRTDSGRGKPMALLLMDLDHFKEINDTMGHHRGDLLLKELGSRLKCVLFAPDTVARLGGDEFTVLLPRLAKLEDIHVVIQKIQDALKSPFMIEGQPVEVEASIGVALYPDHGENPDSLLQRADVAMYRAKETGSGYLIYDVKFDEHSPRRLALIGELRQAIEKDQLFLHYQPKINLKTKYVIGVEALVRWQHPKYGFVPPDEFILSAEQTGLIHPLARWVLKTAMRQSQAWRQTGLNLPVSVNLSARNLHDSQFPDHLAELLKITGGMPEQLELEITESAIMADPQRALEIITRLRTMGLRLALDDFGIGYSSLAYLKKLPVNTIKIDKSFVIDMAKDEDAAVIVLSTINLAHNLGLKVVAEGVETEKILDKLSTFGCDEAQGYYMSKPLPVDALTRWLKESPWRLK